jgi:hypothetical protein
VGHFFLINEEVKEFIKLQIKESEKLTNVDNRKGVIF